MRAGFMKAGFTKAGFTKACFHALLLCALAAPAVAADEAPARFGDDHDDPRTAYPSPVPAGMQACVVEVLRHGFDSFEPATARIDAAQQCPGPWHKVVLRIDGAVEGRQYDRIGHVAVGGVTIFRTSTPEPSREGIAWRVEKNVSAYAPLFASPQPVEMHVGNVVNETYTGIFDIRLQLLFYRADEAHPAAGSADLVLPLQGLREDGQDTAGTATIPANTERLVAEVYATGSGGGCEEFWYFATTAEGYWCRASQGPYREVQVLVDGRLAGIAAPYPHIYTGGWSNPFLWYAIPAPRAFDIRPIRYELTPFIGLLNDGKLHEIRFRVAGLDAEREGWKLLPNLQVWRDPGGARTEAQLLQAEAGALALEPSLDTLDTGSQRMHTRWQRRFEARGVVRTSHGTVETTVQRSLEGDVHHRWSAQEDGDDHLLTQWRDRETVTRAPHDGAAQTDVADQRFGFDGSIVTHQAAGKPQLTTSLDIHDATERVRHVDGRPATTRSRDRFSGSASWTVGVPREQRDATAHTRQTYRHEDGTGCYQRRIENRNGRFVADEKGCGATEATDDATVP